jgi:hypothetical protein
MLPLGRLSKRGPVGPEHESYFTAEEQKTLMTLWCLFRSPLFVGGNLPEMKSETLELLKNPEVLEVHKSSEGAHPYGPGTHPDLWIARGHDPCTVYIGFFNLTDDVSGQVISWKEMGWSAPPLAVRDLWQRRPVKTGATGLEVQLPPHGSALYSIQLREAHVPVQRPAGNKAPAPLAVGA